MGHNWVIAMWVTSGLFCGSVGQMGQQERPIFNPNDSYMRSPEDDQHCPID